MPIVRKRALLYRRVERGSVQRQHLAFECVGLVCLRRGAADIKTLVRLRAEAFIQGCNCEIALRHRSITTSSPTLNQYGYGVHTIFPEKYQRNEVGEPEIWQHNDIFELSLLE